MRMRIPPRACGRSRSFFMKRARTRRPQLLGGVVPQGKFLGIGNILTGRKPYRVILNQRKRVTFRNTPTLRACALFQQLLERTRSCGYSGPVQT